MKKLLLLICLILLNYISYSQGSTCATAINFAPPDTFLIDENQTIQTQWFQFQASGSDLRITLLNRVNSTSDKANKIFLWGGSCGTLSLLGTDTLNSSSDSALSITIGSLISGATYYLQVNKFTNVDTIRYFVDKNYMFAVPTCTVCATPADACNLVCNGSFETHSGVPSHPYDDGGQIWLACGWSSPTLANTPDLYTPGGLAAYSTPNNWLGSYAAHTGNSYAGFWTHSFDAEYVYQQLRCPLIAGVTYDVSFWVNRAEPTTPPFYGYETKLGAWFTNSAGLAPYSSITNYIPVTPQILNTTPLIAPGWVNISGSFVATGNETFIVIGNYNSPTVSTVRTYYFLDDVSVTPDMGSSLMISATPNPVVCGQPFTLTNTYGLPLDWQPNGSLSCNNCVSPTGSISSTTTYTGTITYCTGCAEKANVTVTTVPVNTTVSAAPSKVCSGANSILTASGATTYTWSSGATPTGVNTASVSPIVTTTYTVTGSTGTCSTTATVTVVVFPLPPAPIITGNPSSCSPGVAQTYSISNFNSGSTYSVLLLPLSPSPGTYTAVDAFGNFTVTWNSSNGGTISVSVTDANGCSNNSTFFVGSCCNYGSHTFVDGNTSTDVFGTYGSYILTDELFSINGTFTVNTNMTWKGCQVKLGPNAVINILPGKTLYLTQSANTFTYLSACDYMWDKIRIQGGGTLIADKNTLIEDGKSAIYSENGGKYQFDNARLNRNFKDMVLTPFAGTHPGTIVNTNLTCQTIITGTPPTLNNPFSGYRTSVGMEINTVQNVTIGLAGGSNTNKFKNMNLGINSIKSSVTVINNDFKDMNTALAPNTGIAAIQAVGYPPFPVIIRSLIVGDGTNVGANLFGNCSNGIITQSNMDVNINHNDFQNINNTAIFIKDGNQNNTVSVTDNDIKTSSIGVHCLNNTLCNSTIQYNRIVSMKNFSTGIWLQEKTSMSIGAVYTVFDNVIHNVEYGIRAENLNKATLDNNKIETEPYAPASIVSIGIQVVGNYGTRVTANNIKTIPATYATKNGGVSASLSPASYIYCNTVKDMGYGIKCAGQMASDIFNNSINNDFYGFWLDNSGFVGLQDDPSNANQPNYNKWTNTPTVSGSFRCFSSLASDGNISQFVYKTAPTIPLSLVNSYKPFPASNDGLAGSNSILPIPTSTGSITSPSCPVVLAKLLKRAQDIAMENINFPGNDANGKWLNKHGLLVNIKNDNIDVSSDGILQTFVNQSATENIGKLLQLNSTITDPTKYNASDMSTAQALSSTISPNNDIETNQKLINDIVINNYLTNSNYSPSQINDLHTLANKCPFTDGVGVYQARVLLAEVDPLGTIYYSACEMGEEARMMNANTLDEEIIPFSIFPNPANSQLTITYELSLTDVAKFEIYNVIGEKVLAQIINVADKSQTFSVSELNSGVYFYNYIINNQIVRSNKLVIVK